MILKSTKTKKSRNKSKKGQLSLFYVSEKKWKITKRYLNRILQNKQKKLGNIWSKYKAFILWSICVSVIYFIIFSPFFNITNIYIYREDPISNIEQAYRTVNYIRNNKIFSIDSKQLADRLRNSQKNLQAIQIEKKFPKTINIYLDSYAPIFTSEWWLILQNWSYIENDGGLILEIDELSLIPKISEIEWVIDFKHLEIIQNIHSLIEKNILWSKVIWKEYYIKEEELLIWLDTWWIIIFDLEQNINDQIKKIAIYSNENTSLTKHHFVYIDTRINGRLYVCPLESEFVCVNTLKNIYSNDLFNRLDLKISQNQPEVIPEESL